MRPKPDEMRCKTKEGELRRSNDAPSSDGSTSVSIHCFDWTNPQTAVSFATAVPLMLACVNMLEVSLHQASPRRRERGRRNTSTRDARDAC